MYDVLCAAPVLGILIGRGESKACTTCSVPLLVT